MLTVERWSCPTAVTVGHGATAAVLAQLGRGGRTVLVADAALAERTREVGRALGAARVLTVDAGWSGADTVREFARTLADERCTALVGLGGGSVLDLVKLASAAVADPRVPPLLEARAGRGGLILLPGASSAARPAGSPATVLLPTTVGTGVEVSAVACLTTGRGKRLVSGGRLRPDLAVLDSANTATLPHRLVVEGVLEALLRVLGSAIGTESGPAYADGEAAGLAGRLVATGTELAGGRDDAEVRLAASQLSAATHTGWALVGRAPFAAKHWYLANELSTALGVRKMTATATLLPAVWQRIQGGDLRFGHPERLRTAWSWVHAAAPEHPAEPVPGIRSLLSAWDVRAVSGAAPQALDRAARAAVESWGGRLPMLAGIDTADARALYEQACW
ncbi:daptide-type RiPP biosynthesis dehydogenase [Kitasatospora sp. NPDC101155]|uniref:daptide-type RiPP biosynthesis dehydogenase n=1 Tax=Kitasatospora sp. NPDC101155 TaxID=3364097 RepID=UPI00381AB54F